MKKLFIVLSVFICVSINAQISVAPSTALQMAELITNPRCITVTGLPKIVSGADFAGNPNSVGVFTAGAGSAFPFAKGIVLSTGALTKVPGPKDLPNYAGDGTATWPSDADMNATLGQSNFINASSLEFNFTSLKPTFKINFLFSSEEYGSFQCNPLADDTMVILLTDLTTNITTNIAATPSVISVNNIRRSINNTNCADSNPSFFGTIYNNASGATAPINFLGSTIPMSANYSLLVPGRSYKLKIVIADRSASGYNSAVFVGNYIEQVQTTTTLLGPDLVGNLASCEGTPITLTANVTGPTTVVRWRKDGIIIPGENGLTLNINNSNAPATPVGNHLYTFSYLTNTCGNFDGQSDSIVVDFLAPTVTPNPITLSKCSSANYNLADNTAIISAGLSFVPTITYHTDAACLTPALATNYTGNATTIYVLIARPGTPTCPIIKSFTLEIVNDPIALAVGPQQGCSTFVNGPVSFFSLPSLSASILGATQSNAIYGVSYHSSLVGAQTNTAVYSTSGNGTFSNFPTGIIYVRVYVKGNQSCFDATQSFQFTVNPRLAVDKPAPIVYCGTQFILPPLINGRYFDKPYIAGDANSQLPELFAGDIITSSSSLTNSRTIYVSVLKDANGLPCSEPEWPLKITFVKVDQFKVPAAVLECDRYTLPAPQYGNYYTGPDGFGSIITEVVNTTNATTVTEVYYYFESSLAYEPLNPQCVVNASNTSRIVTLEVKPDIGAQRPNIFTCNPPYVLPTLAFEGFPNAKYYNGPNGTLGEITDLNINPIAPGVPTTKEIFIYEEGTGTKKCPAQQSFKIFIGLEQPNIPPACNINFPDLSPGQYWSGPGGTGTQYAIGQPIPTSGTYYLYVPLPNGAAPCTPGGPFQNEIPFTVTVSNPPINNLQFQGLGTDGNPEKVNGVDFVQTANDFFSPSNIVNISCGPVTLKPIANGKYFTESQLSGSTSGTELFPNDVITASSTSPTTSVFVYTAPFPGLTCASEREFKFKILEKPVVEDIIGSFTNCQNGAYKLPTIPTGLGEFYTAPGGPSGGGVLLNTAASQEIPSPFSGNFYLYKANSTDPSCFTEKTLKIDLNIDVILQPFTPAVVERCATFTLPPITAGKYYDVSNLSSLTDPSATALTNLDITIPLTTTLPYLDKTFYNYAATYRSDGTRQCQDEESFRLLLYKQPTINTLTDMYFCGPTQITGADLPTLGGTNISTSLPAKYYTQSHLGGGNGGTAITATTVLTNGQTIYAYVKNESIVANSTFAGCFDEKSFKINIFKVDTGSNIVSCGSQSLATLPALSVGSYFNNPNGTSPLSQTDLENTGTTPIVKTVYIYAPSGFPAGKCQSDFSTFTITINPLPVTFPVALVDRTFCDQFDNQNDGVYNVALSQFDATIKGLSQTGNQFTVTYHASLADANSYSAANNNAITASSVSPIFAVVRNSTSTICISAPYQLDFIINKLPEPQLEDKIICVDNKTNLAPAGTTVTLNSMLSAADHTFEWKDKNGIMTTELGNSLTTSLVGIYSVIAKNTGTGCVSKSVSASVIASSIAITAYTVTQNFEDNQTIVVIATGANTNFEYSLDGAPFVDSNIFENLTTGDHTILVRDKYGCGDAPPLNVPIINYPKYFTPNGDSFNDSWNIRGLENQSGAKIAIFDRQGKLLKQISPNSIGWDGTYNSVAMPANDYWFVVRYLEEGTEKEFKSHFSLKR